MERGGFRGRGGPPRGGVTGRGRGGFNGARGRGAMGARGGGVRGAAGGRGGIPRGRGGVGFTPAPNHSNVLVVSSRGRGGVTDVTRGGMRGVGGRGGFRGGVAGVAGGDQKFRGRGGRGGDRGMMGRGGMGRGAGADRGALKRVQPVGGIPPKRGRYDAAAPNGYNQYQGYEQAVADSYGPQAAAPVAYGSSQGYNNGGYGSSYGGGQVQSYTSQGYGGYGQGQGYDSGVAADYASGGYPPAQDTRYQPQQAQSDPYGDYNKPTRHYEAENYTPGYQGGGVGGYQAGYDDRSGYQSQAYDTSGYGGAASVQPTHQQYGGTAGYAQSRDYNQHRSRY